MSESVIHDIGYQRYAGPRLGRGYGLRSLYGYGLRAAFGLGRGAKAKIFPWIVVGIVLAVFLVILFCAVVAPELVSRDLRSGVLPLYFSRPLTRADYALAKLAALVSAVWLLLAGPQLLMFVGGAFTVHGPRAVWNEFLDFLPGVLFSGVYAVVFSAIALLVASMASRRAVAAAVIVAVFLVTTPVVGVLSVTGGDAARQLAFLASPMTAVTGLGVWLFDLPNIDIGPFGPIYGFALLTLVVACVSLLLARYWKVAR